MRLSSLLLSATLLACGGSKKPLDTADPSKDADTEDSGNNGADTHSSTDSGASDSDSDSDSENKDSADTDSSNDTSGSPEAGPNARADFKLTDVNSSSPRNQEAVSPRDYLQKVSGWYFTHPT